MGGIGRREEDARPTRRFDHGSRRSTRGFSHATLSAIEDDIRLASGGSSQAGRCW